MIINGGTGNGYAVKVTEDNKLGTHAISEVQADHQSELGNRYNINSGDITLTGNATASGCLYLKNTENEDVHVTALIYNLGATTSGTGDMLVEVYRNPTAGTLISTATAVSVNSNFNFGSTNTLSCLAYKGAEGLTITDGTVFATTRVSAIGRTAVNLGTVVLPKGSSIAIRYTTPASNSSQKVQFAFACFKQTLDV